MHQPNQTKPNQPKYSTPLLLPIQSTLVLTLSPLSLSLSSPLLSPMEQPNPNAHTFTSPHPIYAMAISPSPSPSPLQLALGSFLESPTNHISLLSFSPSLSSFLPSFSLPHPFPPSKLLFHPQNPALLASSGEFLRLWELREGEGEMRSVMNNSKSSEFSAPLTSFDWNEAEPRRIGTASIDTTCTIWDVERGVVETQLIAHDKEVYDIAWGEAGVFASVSADGSVRIFDLRDKEHSTIVYESPRPDTPLLRLAWNKADPRFIACTLMDSNRIIILDIRSPAVPVAELLRHRACVNAIAWAPSGPRHLCSGGDDGQALIWEVPAGAQSQAGAVLGGELDPVLGYSAGAEVNQVQWSPAHPDWIGIAFGNNLQLLRV